MTGLKLDMRLEGLGQALAKFKNAGNKIPVRSMKKAMKDGGEPIKSQASLNSPVDTGALKRSMSTKAKSYRRGAYLLTVIGPKNFKYKSGKNPAKYAHLVEQGHRTRGGGFVQPRGFMRRAAQQSFPVALRRFENAIRTHILGDFQ